LADYAVTMDGSFVEYGEYVETGKVTYEFVHVLALFLLRHLCSVVYWGADDLNVF